MLASTARAQCRREPTIICIVAASAEDSGGGVVNKSSLGGGAATCGGNTHAGGFGGGNVLHAQTDEKVRDVRRVREGNSATGTVTVHSKAKKRCAGRVHFKVK